MISLYNPTETHANQPVMPKNTKVAKCVEKVKRTGHGKNPYAICQADTHQSYATGKKLPKRQHTN